MSEYKQLHLTDQPQFRQGSFEGRLNMHLRVVEASDFYKEHSPNQYKESLDFVSFWGQIASAIPLLDLPLKSIVSPQKPDYRPY